MKKRIVLAASRLFLALRSLQSRVKAMNGKMGMQRSAQSGVSADLEFDVTA